MRDESLKATYINLLILAAADGKIDPAERDYLKRFAEISGITEDQERRWKWELDSGKISFRTIEEPADAKEALALMARMVRVDGVFDPAEQEAYINMGKALGFAEEELGPVLREYWNKDPLEGKVEKAPPSSPDGPAVLVVEDDLGERAVMEKAAPGAAIQYTVMSALSGLRTAPDIVIFHAAEERLDSKKRLEVLSSRFSKSFVAFVARRDQAPQIGWLLGLGAKRCFVEPLYRGEIGNALPQMK